MWWSALLAWEKIKKIEQALELHKGVIFRNQQEEQKSPSQISLLLGDQILYLERLTSSFFSVLHLEGSWFKARCFSPTLKLSCTFLLETSQDESDNQNLPVSSLLRSYKAAFQLHLKWRNVCLMNSGRGLSIASVAWKELGYCLFLKGVATF